jgi:hypothetical protein
MNDPTDNRTRDEFFEHVARALRLLKQKVSHAEKATITREETLTFISSLESMCTELQKLQDVLGEDLLNEILRGDGDTLEAMQRLAYSGWRRSPFVEIYAAGAQRNAVNVGRALYVLWHPSVQVCDVWDTALQGVGKPLGWHVVAIAHPDGRVEFAPDITVERREGSVHVTQGRHLQSVQ